MNILSIVFAFVFCSTGILHAQDKAQLVPATFRDFSGGLVDSVDPLNLPSNSSPDLMNVVIDNPLGSLKPRNGISRVANLPSGNKPTAFYEYINQNGLKYFIATDNANIYATRDFVSWTTIKSGLTDANIPSFSSVRSKLWIVTGSTWAMTWDGTTTTLLSGAGSTPSPPPLLCRYLEFWKELVWCARSNTYPSGIQFSQLDDTAGNDLDPSTGAVSWPATNVINVNQDAGNPIYGLKVYRDRLYAFKLDGIYQIFYENPVNISVAKVSNNGAKYNTAIQELDNILYYVGIDGTYAFDGQQSQRISDSWENTFKSINQLDATEGYKQWDSKADWDLGTFSQTESDSVSGSVFLSSSPTNITNGSFEDGTFTGFSTVAIFGGNPISSTSTAQGFNFSVIDSAASGVHGAKAARMFSAGLQFTQNSEINIVGVSGSTIVHYNLSGAPPAGMLYRGTSTIKTGSFAGQWVYINFVESILNNGNQISASLYSSSFQARGIISFYAYAYDDGTQEKAGWTIIDNIKFYNYYGTGTYISEVYDGVDVSTWTTINATFVENGGSVSLGYRTGANAADIATTTWSTITAGGYLSAASGDRYFQFIATLTASSNFTESPEFADASISFYQGSGNTNPIYMYPVNNRLWINSSVGNAVTNNRSFVKSRYPLSSFVPYDLQIGPIIRYSNNYYAGASTHSAIYRIDYGNTDDTRVIDWYWTSRDEAWGDPWVSKLLYEISTDFRGDSATNAQVGYSLDGGLTFTSKTADMAVSGRNTDRRYFSSPRGQAIRLRVGDSTAGESATILGVTGWAYPEKMRR